MKRMVFMAAITFLIIGAIAAEIAAAAELKWVGCDVLELSVMQSISKEYEKKTGVKISLDEAGATRGIVDVVSGKADIGGTCRHAIARTEERGAKLIVVAWDAIVVVTHKSNPVDNLTLEQIRNIFTGKLSNWKSVGGPDRPVQVVAREGKLSGVGRMVRELLFKNPEQDFTPKALLFKSTGPVEETVEKTPWTIAFTGVSSAAKRSFKMLKIEGKAPSYNTIARGEYMLYRPLYLVTRQDASPEVKGFIAFVLSDEGQAIIKKEGTVTLKDGQVLWQKYGDH
ncbi:MAG: phosphate ABC transporter substrate-binding protein [Nitrospirae bacterium]|nr:phosphate ABC transporter substrate-binding protein [Nitrospirota bacterium]